MILNAYTRPRSPFYWIQYSLGPGHPRKFEKSNIRKDDPKAEHKLAVYLNQLEAALLSASQGEKKDDVEVTSWGWVLPWLRVSYAQSPATLKVYTAQWTAIVPFLAEFEIPGPRFLTRENAFTYLAWRTGQKKAKSGKYVSTNTAVGELKLLGMVLDEALARRMITDNPTRKLGISKEETELKPELEDATIAEIYQRLQSKPLWMQRSFHVALNTGLRFSETAISRKAVRWQDGEITIGKPKGGSRKAFSIPIYAGIRPMLEEWYFQSKEPFLWQLPPNEREMTGLVWHKFFHEELQRPDLCFHCTRVTFVTRGIRAGVPENVMQKMVNHASKLVNRIYQRMTADDVRRWAERVSIPSAPAATSQNPTKTRA